MIPDQYSKTSKPKLVDLQKNGRAHPAFFIWAELTSTYSLHLKSNKCLWPAFFIATRQFDNMVVAGNRLGQFQEETEFDHLVWVHKYGTTEGHRETADGS